MKVPARRMRRPEQDLQRTVVAFLRRFMPEPPEGAFWFHVPNGGGRSKIEGAIFKAMGVKAGVPDLIFIWRGRTIAIELKGPDGRLTAIQKEVQSALTLAGAVVHEARSLEAVVEFLKVVGIPIRAEVRA